MDAGVAFFCRLSLFFGPLCVGVGRPPLNASVASPMTLRLAQHRTLRPLCESQRSFVASTLTAGDAEQRRASSDACVPARLC